MKRLFILTTSSFVISKYVISGETLIPSASYPGSFFDFAKYLGNAHFSTIVFTDTVSVGEFKYGIMVISFLSNHSSFILRTMVFFPLSPPSIVLSIIPSFPTFIAHFTSLPSLTSLAEPSLLLLITSYFTSCPTEASSPPTTPLINVPL